MKLINALNWRYATKRMNGNAVPAEKLENILEATRLSASSMGLQPYSILVIEDETLRTKIRAAAFDQPQITEGSHLLVFAAWDNVSEAQVDEYMNDIVTTRGVSHESLSTFREQILGLVNGRTAQQNYEWAARQAYIAFGTALAAAALEEVDATPMEGFDPAGVDEILGLREKGLRSVTLLPLGYRDAGNDYLFGQKKVRRSKNELIVKVSPEFQAA